MKLEIFADGKLVFEREVHDWRLGVQRDIETLMSDPAMAAALAGASPEVLMNMPPPSSVMVDMGGDIELVMHMRMVGKGTLYEDPSY